MLGLVAFLLLLALPVQAQDMVVQPQFDAAGTFHDGVAPVKQGQLWGLVDRTGAFVVPPQYLNIGPGRSGYFAVETQDDFGTWNFIDANGKRLMTHGGAEKVRRFRQGWAAVSSYGDQWTLIDTNGASVSSTSFDEIADWEPPFALVRWGTEWKVVHIGNMGFTNALNVEFIEAMQDVTRLPHIADRYFTAISSAGEFLLEIADVEWAAEPQVRELSFEAYLGPVRFLKTSVASDGMIAIQDQQSLWGFFHIATRKQIWMGRFEQVRRFSEGYAAVKLKGKWGYIDKRGQFAVQPRYDRAYDLHQGHATVRLGDKRGFLRLTVDNGLTEFIAPQFEDVFRFQDGLAPVKLNGKWGYISNELSPAPSLRQSPVQSLAPD